MIAFSQIDLRGVRAVFIDIDDTLYTYAQPHEAGLASAYRFFFDKISKERGEAEFALVYQQSRQAVLERLKPSGSCRSRLFAFQAMMEAWKIPLSYDWAEGLERVYWEAFLPAMKPDGEALAFLRRCKASGLPVCAVSDMQSEFQVQKLRALGASPYIDYLVTSEEVGVEKPHPSMFLRALEKVRCEPSEVIMVGDSKEKDIDGAQALGIRAHQIALEAEPEGR